MALNPFKGCGPASFLEFFYDRLDSVRMWGVRKKFVSQTAVYRGQMYVRFLNVEQRPGVAESIPILWGATKVVSVFVKDSVKSHNASPP